MKWIKLGFVFLLIGTLLGAVLAVAVLQPYAGFQGETFVDIPRGTSVDGMARLLADAGAIRTNWQFLLVRAFRPRQTLQAGEYRFEKPASAWTVYHRIARGDVHHYVLRVPEGSNIFDIADSLADLGLMSRDEFLSTVRDPELIRDLAPAAPTLEGYLFPSTYRLTRRTTARQLAAMMTGEFREAWKKLAPADGSGPDNVHDTVTLASLVEKETAVAGERPLVAAVFTNRLRKGMRLECDPTTIYAALLEDRYRGTIYRSDLENKHRYNTYQHAGLPPGPIANPGLESLKATLDPADTNHLFFVARPDSAGAHEFSETFTAHQRAVQQYRRANGKSVEKNGARAVPGRKKSGHDR